MTGPTFWRITMLGGLLAATAAYATTSNLQAAAIALWLGTGLAGGMTVLAAVAWEALQDRRPSGELAEVRVLHGRPTALCPHGTPRSDYCPACRVRV